MKSLLGFALLASSAFAATINTGTAAWQVNSNPAVIETGTIPVQPGFVGGWVAPIVGGGVWVGTSATDGRFGGGTDGAPSNSTYTFTLNLGSIVATGGGFSLQYAADNSIAWSISGGGTLSGATTCGASDPFGADCFSSLRSLSGTFTSTSILTAVVTNGPSASGSRSPMGLLVTGTADSVPEPSTYAMLTLGGAAIAFARLRRK